MSDTDTRMIDPVAPGVLDAQRIPAEAGPPIVVSAALPRDLGMAFVRLHGADADPKGALWLPVDGAVEGALSALALLDGRPAPQTVGCTVSLEATDTGRVLRIAQHATLDVPASAARAVAYAILAAALIAQAGLNDAMRPWLNAPLARGAPM